MKIERGINPVVLHRKSAEHKDKGVSVEVLKEMERFNRKQPGGGERAFLLKTRIHGLLNEWRVGEAVRLLPDFAQYALLEGAVFSQLLMLTSKMEAMITDDSNLPSSPLAPQVLTICQVLEELGQSNLETNLVWLATLEAQQMRSEFESLLARMSLLYPGHREIRAYQMNYAHKEGKNVLAKAG
ncbi:MAG: hypothetical protein IT288_09275 [Bdellovibrionales bacterium]|nr:hypothetical protein [Bdellovibrionales bacterium]